MSRNSECPSGSRAGGGGGLLVNCVPMREQRTAKVTLNSVFDVLKLIPLFTVSSQKVTLSNVVNLNAHFLTSAAFCKICKNTPFSNKNSNFLPFIMTALRTAQLEKKYPFSSYFCSRIGTQLTRKRPRGVDACSGPDKFCIQSSIVSSL